MWKRLGALLFIFILGGQVWAGVCGCLGDSAPKMKCCKKKSGPKRDKMSRATCCDTVCGLPAGERPHRLQNETAFKLAVISETVLARFEFAPPVERMRPVRSIPAPVQLAGKFSRPPNLYLQNHSFLI